MQIAYIMMIIGVAMLQAGASPSPAGETVLTAAQELVADFYGEFESDAFDVDRLMRHYDPDVVFVDPTFDIEVNGVAAVRELYAVAGTAESRYRGTAWEIERVIASGADVAIHGTWSGRFDDKPFSVEFVTLWKLSDGKIVEQRDFFDAIGFDEQVDRKGADPY